MHTNLSIDWQTTTSACDLLTWEMRISALNHNSNYRLMKIALLGKHSVFNAKVLDQKTIDKNKLPDLFRCYNSSLSNYFPQHRNWNTTSGIRRDAPPRYATTDLSPGHNKQPNICLKCSLQKSTNKKTNKQHFLLLFPNLQKYESCALQFLSNNSP